MLDATSPFEAQSAREDKTRVDGRAEIRFAQKGGQTRLARLYQHEPLRVLFPAPASGDIPQAALVTTSGGLVGGVPLTMRLAG